MLPDYTSGTVSISNGSTALTGSGTAWKTAALKAGDIFYKAGYAILIASVGDEDEITLADAWPGTALEDASYAIRFAPDNSRMQGTGLEVLRQLRQGIWLTPDATGKTSDKATYDDKPTGFRFLDVSVDPFTLYVKESDTSADWSDGADWVGPKGDDGDQGPAGADGDITWEGAWVTAAAYTANQAVSNGGSSYVCVENHTSGTFATDLAAGKWELMAAKGDTGATGATGPAGADGADGADGTGTGDMLASTYDPNGKEANAFSMDNMVEGSTTKILTATERTKIGNALTAASTITESLVGRIQAPLEQTYLVGLKIPFGFTITETVTKCESGSCTATFKIDTTALGGTANSISTTEQSQAQASSNTGTAGQDINLVISSNSSCVGLSFSVKLTRALS
jgi:hypothetical protein